MSLQLLMSPSDPESAKPSGGVAILARRGWQLAQLAPRTPAFAQAQALGRALLALTSLPGGRPALLISLYGWTNGNRIPENAARTNSLVHAAFQEVAMWNRMPAFFAGDLNADPVRLPSLAVHLEHDRLIDIGAHADVWGGTPCEPTTRAHGAKRESRCCYHLCTPEALPLVTAFLPGRWDLFDVHRPLALHLATAPAPRARQLRVPASLAPRVAARDGETKQQYITRARSCMDAHLLQHASALYAHLQAWRIDQFWSVWSECVQSGLIDASAVARPTACKMARASQVL